MAFKPSPKVTAARDYARKFNRKMVIILAIGGDGLEYVSYGATKNLCEEAKIIAEVAFNALMRWGEQ